MVESQDSFYANPNNYNMDDNFGSSLMRIDTGDLLHPDSDDLSKILDFNSEDLEANLNMFNPQQIAFHAIPPHLQNLPEVEDIDNDWLFNMELKSESSNKSTWLYSSLLNKVFVKMSAQLNDHTMNVYPFFERKGLTMGSFYIRAMIVYSSHNDLPEPVNKCPNHKNKDVESKRDPADHILRCTNRGTEYIGHSAGKLFAEKLAFRINLANIASNEPLTLQFTCQNSCSGGMNRKSTSLVFTLEDEAQVVLGRKVMQFKVCSCPKRDKEKDEAGLAGKIPSGKKRKAEAPNLPSTSAKRMALPRQDSDTPLTDITETMIKVEPETPCELKVMLPNEKLKKEALNLIYNSVAGELARTGNETLKLYLNEIKKQIGK